MRKLAAAIILALAATGIAPLAASATPTTPSGADSEGYVWHIGSPAGGKLMRYNIAEGVDEQIYTGDPSCNGLGLSRLSDFEVDEEHGYIYWVADVSVVGRFNLRTGVCQELARNENRNPNNLWATWRGIVVDKDRNRLFFVDNQGHALNGITTVNQTLHYIDLATAPATGHATDTIIPIQMAAGEVSDVNFAADILLDGDFAYIAGRNTDGEQLNGEPQGSALYRVRVYDAVTKDVLTSVESERVFSFVTGPSVDPQIQNIELHNGLIYFSPFIWSVGGIRSVDLSGYTTNNPVTSYETLVQNNNTFDLLYGFTFAQNDVVFTTDRPVWPGPFFMVWLDGSIGAPTVNSGTTISNAYVDTDYYGKMKFNLTAGPSQPVIDSVSRDSDTAGSFTFTPPTDATANTKYDFTAVGSDNSVITGVCTSSPCGMTGLVAGISYDVTVRQVWMNGSNPIIQSLRSEPVNAPVYVAPLSDNTNLTSFTVNGVTKTVGSTVSVAAGTTSVTVVGVAEDSAATVSYAGTTGLQTGDNTITITVTAENGDTMDYTFIVNVATPAPPAFQTVSKTFTGFATYKSNLTTSQKSAIRSWINAKTGATSISCVGYVGNNWKGSSAKALKALALARAKAACNYAKSVKSGLTVTKTSIKVTSSKSASVRKVVITLK